MRKLSPGSRAILLELSLFKSDEEIDDNTFAVLKAFYATLVSKNRMELCMRAWKDTEKLAVGYGKRTISNFIEAPYSLAYTLLLSVTGPKNKYDNDDDVSLYSMFLSKVTDYVQKHGEEIFFCCTTRSTFDPPPKKEKNKLTIIV